jgi:plastocyanin
MKTKKNKFSKEIATASILTLVMIVIIGISTSVASAQDTTASNVVVIQNSAFSPQLINISAGENVTWVNDDSTYHRIVADNGQFESPILAQGENYTYEFDTAGVYLYHCGIHPTMTAEVDVSGQNPLTNETNQTVNQNPNQTINETTNETTNQTTNETIGNQTGNVTVGNQTTNQTINQTNPPPGSSQMTVKITGEGFEPQNATIHEGDTVEWINEDSTNHKLQSDEFNSPDVPPRASYYFAFKIAGNYSYTDAYTNMTGQIIVLAAINQTTNETNQTGNQTTNETVINQTNATRGVMNLHYVTISNNAFSPQIVTGYAGDLVQWSNEEAATHQISSKAFHSPNMTIGDAYAFVFDIPGTYGYSDGLHPDVKGTIVILPVAGSNGTTNQTPSNEGVTVRIQNLSFNPSSATINRGENVTWINEDSVYHEINGKGFSSRKLSQGETYSVEFDTSGQYSYYDGMFSSVRGQIIVN